MNSQDIHVKIVNPSPLRGLCEKLRKPKHDLDLLLDLFAGDVDKQEMTASVPFSNSNFAGRKTAPKMYCGVSLPVEATEGCSVRIRASLWTLDDFLQNKDDATASIGLRIDREAGAVLLVGEDGVEEVLADATIEVCPNLPMWTHVKTMENDNRKITLHYAPDLAIVKVVLDVGAAGQNLYLMGDLTEPGNTESLRMLIGDMYVPTPKITEDLPDNFISEKDMRIVSLSVDLPEDIVKPVKEHVGKAVLPKIETRKKVGRPAASRENVVKETPLVETPPTEENEGKEEIMPKENTTLVLEETQVDTSQPSEDTAAPGKRKRKSRDKEVVLQEKIDNATALLEANGYVISDFKEEAKGVLGLISKLRETLSGCLLDLDKLVEADRQQIKIEELANPDILGMLSKALRNQK